MKDQRHFLKIAAVVGVTSLAFAWPSLVRRSAAQDEYKRDLARAQAVAVPPNERPKRFIVSDFLVGSQKNSTAENLDDGLQLLSLLGINTVQVRYFGDQTSHIEETARKYGITRFRQAIYSPLPIPADRSPALYFSWNTEETNPTRVEAWAQEQIRAIRFDGIHPENVVLFHMADEPAWYYPDILAKMSATPQRLKMFQDYLQSKGLKPSDVGAGNWAMVRPIPISQANDLPSRRLYYWTTLYLADTAADGFKIWKDALCRAINPNLLVGSNWNNWISRYYIPSPGEAYGKNKLATPDSAVGSLDWMQTGRKHALSVLWSEDWFPDVEAESWSYYADALRCAARAGQGDGSPPEFGGYVVGQRLGDHPAGGRYKAMSLIGHGAKVLEWYVYGPKSKFSNGYSENEKAYEQIASANRLIGRAEDLLYPGRRADARIAILLPRSAQVWDQSPILPLYQAEGKGIHYALTHMQYPVDFVDETDIESGDFARRNYQMIYVTAPNMTAASQTALRDWIQQGGTAIFSPAAATADEYNTPTTILDEARGVRSQILPRRSARDDQTLRTQVKFLDNQWGDNIAVKWATQPLQLTGAKPLALFGDQKVALASNRFGKGWAVTFGFWAGTAYLNSSWRGQQNRLPTAYNKTLRMALTAPPRLTNIVKPVEVGTEVIEASRLDSAAGSAVTLFNWLDEPQDQVTVRIRNAGDISSVSSVEQGNLQFTREGDDIRVTLPLRDVDVLLLRH